MRLKVSARKLLPKMRRLLRGRWLRIGSALLIWRRSRLMRGSGCREVEVLLKEPVRLLMWEIKVVTDEMSIVCQPVQNGLI